MAAPARVLTNTSLARSRTGVAAVALGYALLTHGWSYPQTSDGAAMLATAESLVTSGTLAVDDRFTRDDGYGPSARVGRDGRAYSKYGIGLSVVLAPVLAVTPRSSAAGGSRHRLAETALALVNPALAAAAAVATRALAIALGASTGRAAFLAMASVLATPAGWYATSDYAEPLQALLLTLALLGIARSRAAPGPRRGTLVGASLAGLVLTKVALAILVPPLLVGLALAAPCSRRLRTLLAASVPLALAIGGLLALNAWRFGDPFETGYYAPMLTAPLVPGLFALTLSINRGLGWYAPVTLLFPWAWWRARRQAPPLACAIGLAVLACFLFQAKFFEWGGGWCWGPRYLMPVVPAMVATLGALPDTKRARRALLATVVLGTLATASGTLLSENAYRRTVMPFRAWELTPPVTVGTATGVVHLPIAPEDVLPRFSSLLVRPWLLRTVLAGCDCEPDGTTCTCASGDMASDPVFRSAPWAARLPDAAPVPPYGAHLVQPPWLRWLIGRARAGGGAVAGP